MSEDCAKKMLLGYLFILPVVSHINTVLDKQYNVNLLTTFMHLQTEPRAVCVFRLVFCTPFFLTTNTTHTAYRFLP